jgi:hypothetical protein
MDGQVQAIGEFFGLPTSSKLARLLDAVVDLEESLSRQGERRLGHPGEWPGDYNDSIARRLFGIAGHDEPDCRLACWEPLPAILTRFGIKLSDTEKALFARRVDIFAAVSDPGPRMMLVDGMELFPSGKGGISGIDGFVKQNAPIWKWIRSVSPCEQCFLAGYGFAHASYGDRGYVEEGLGRDNLAFVTKALTYAGEDWIGYALGIELT